MTSASKFLTTLFSAYPSDESLRLEIRCLPPAWQADRTPGPRRWYTLGTQFIENAAAACEAWGAEWDVYFGVLARQGRTGSQNDVAWAKWLYVDIDGGDDGVPGAVELIKASGIDLPDIAVSSGGGVHAYWRLDTPAVLCDRDSREAFKRTLRRLVLAIGGSSPAAHADSAAAEVARVLRVPGTWNRKRPDEPRPVRLLRLATGQTIARSYDWWRSRLPVEPIPVRRGPVASKTSYAQGTIPPSVHRWAQEGYPEGKRHHDFVSAAAWLVRDVKVSKADARDLLLLKAQNSPGRRPITPEEIDGVVKWA